MDENKNAKENNIYNYTEVESIRRGSVYYVRRNVDCNFYSGTAIALKNKRPFLVLSEHRDNTYSRVVTCCPIITREENGNEHFEYVNFVDSRGRHVMVNLSQITCVPVEHVKSYIYTVPKEKMDEIDRLIARRLCLEGYIETLVKQYVEDVTGVSIMHSIELDMNVREQEPLSTKQVKDMLYSKKFQHPEEKESQKQKLKQKLVRMDNYEEKMRKLLEIPENTYCEPEEGVHICDVKLNHIDVSELKDIEPERKSTNNWTTEKMQEAVDYRASHTLEETAEKYHLKNNSMYTLLWRAKRKYGITASSDNNLH